MSQKPPFDVHPDCSGIRTILVPADIVAVPRRSPVRVRKRTPWRPQPDGQVTTARVGQREWFSDRVFVESQDDHARTGYGTSVVVHVCLGVALMVFFITRPDRSIFVMRSSALVMPAVLAPLPPMPTVETPSAQTVEPPRSKAVLPAAAPPPAPTPAPDVVAAAAPIEPPTGITPETGAENRAGGVEGGVAGGVNGGVVGGVPGGALASQGPPGPPAVRVGVDMKAPRKIKDVKPVYPTGAMAARTQGAVLIEAIIGTDGKVHVATVLHSVPPLDQAALDAVRQWEYQPSMLNGVPVAVIMTVVVNFALQ